MRKTENRYTWNKTWTIRNRKLQIFTQLLLFLTVIPCNRLKRQIISRRVSTLERSSSTAQPLFKADSSSMWKNMLRYIRRKPIAVMRMCRNTSPSETFLESAGKRRIKSLFSNLSETCQWGPAERLRSCSDAVQLEHPSKSTLCESLVSCTLENK